MERSKYFNYTRPTQTQLNYTESSKGQAIIRRIDSACQMGIAEGFRVTVNAVDATLIDIGAGIGYCGGKYLQAEVNGDDAGERISTLTTEVTGGTISGQALASYTSGTINYVSLVYSETETIPLAETTLPYTEHDTIVAESYRVSVLTATQWAALTMADLRQRILVAKVTAQGAGTALQAANIQQVIQPKTHPTPTQPSNITGVTLSSISDETLIGNGTLRFVAATKTLYWKAPGDAEGTGIPITTSGEYTVYSNDSTYWIKADVTYSGLPVVDQSDTIYIQALYGSTIPKFSAEDTVHRDLTGSGTPAKNNPHGITMNDIEGGTFDHADLFHKNGISYDADSTQLAPTINAVADSIDVTNIGGFSNTFLVDGINYQTLNNIAAGTDGRLYFDITPALASGDYMIYVNSAGDLQYVKIAEYAPLNAADERVLFSGFLEILDMQNKVSGNGTLTWTAADQTLEWQAPGDGAAGTAVKLFDAGIGMLGYAGIYKIYSQDTDNWIIIGVSTGALGGDNASTFDIDLNISDQPFDEFLRVGIVTWNNIGDIHYNLRDIRTFRTADTKDELYEEHDSDGRHTKPISARLKVFDATGPAVYAWAPNMGALAVADTDVGAYCIAAVDSGVYGEAGGDKGVIGGAANDYGGSFVAQVNTGVYAAAVADIGAYIVAGGNTGAYVTVGGNTGAFVQAKETGMRVNATGGNVGIYVSAFVDSGIYVTAKGDGAVLGTVPGTYGGSFGAGNQAVYGSASASFGVRGTAADLAGYFVANGNNGAANIVGLYGSAGNVGAAQKAVGVNGYVGGSAATGVYGQAAHVSYGTGVYGLAGTGQAGALAYGVFGEAGAAGVGVCGLAGVIGLLAKVSAAAGVAARLDATVANGTGMQVWASKIFAEISAPIVATVGALLNSGILVSVPVYGTCLIPLVATV